MRDLARTPTPHGRSPSPSRASEADAVERRVLRSEVAAAVIAGLSLAGFARVLGPLLVNGVAFAAQWSLAGVPR